MARPPAKLYRKDKSELGCEVESKSSQKLAKARKSSHYRQLARQRRSVPLAIRTPVLAGPFFWGSQRAERALLGATLCPANHWSCNLSSSSCNRLAIASSSSICWTKRAASSSSCIAG